MYNIFQLFILLFIVILLQSKKRVKYISVNIVSGDIIGAQQSSWTYILINTSSFIPVHRPITERIMWQDPVLTQWEGAHSRILLESLESRHQWNENSLII